MKVLFIHPVPKLWKGITLLDIFRYARAALK